nr:uroporphyrinogen-III synthase [Sphingobium indicum]
MQDCSLALSTVTGVRFEASSNSDRLVWVTRTAPHNLLTARHLRAEGFNPLIEPVLRVTTIRSGEPIAVPDALVFTSLQGIRRHRFFPSLATLPVFAVGDHSARFARLRGYRNVASAAGDVHDLRRLIRETMRPGSKILHLSAAQPAGNLLEMLREDGFMTQRQCVYEAVEARPQDLDWIAGKLALIEAIMIHSPRAGRHVASWLRQQIPCWKGKVVCISAAAAAAFEGLPGARTVVAARPNEADLMAVLNGST